MKGTIEGCSGTVEAFTEMYMERFRFNRGNATRMPVGEDALLESAVYGWASCQEHRLRHSERPSDS